MTANATDRSQDHSGRRNWKDEYAQLSALDRQTTLEPADLERLGIAAYLAGHESDSIDVHTRAHTLALSRGDTRQAARSAFWIAFGFLATRELTRASGWVARARRLLEEDRHDCVECGFLLLPQAIEQVVAGDLAGAETTFAAAERLGERFADSDLISLARQGRGRVLVATGRVGEGVALFDEVMVAVTAGEVAPIICGVVYCSVISACFDLLDIRRAREWTDALNDWCEAQPDLVPYRGECLTHRAEILPAPRRVDRGARRCPRRVRRAGLGQAWRPGNGRIRACGTASPSRRPPECRRLVPARGRARARTLSWPGAVAPRRGTARGSPRGNRACNRGTCSRAAPARRRARGGRGDFSCGRRCAGGEARSRRVDDDGRPARFRMAARHGRLSRRDRPPCDRPTASDPRTPPPGVGDVARPERAV